MRSQSRDPLRGEVYRCGRLSQIDRVLGKSGPYAPYLALAGALEYAKMRAVAPRCET